jgi:hypothetical protein
VLIGEQPRSADRPPSTIDYQARNKQSTPCASDVPTIIGRSDRPNPRDDNRSTYGNHQSGTLERIMPGPTSRSSSFALALALLAAFQTATPVLGWGRLCHRVISRLAEKRLTPAAKAAIVELLEPGESLADASL